MRSVKSHSNEILRYFIDRLACWKLSIQSNMSKKRKNLKKRVQFHRKSGVFELRPGNMLYAFCVNAGGHLEHLYWGEDIGESESLSYLQSSNVKIAFQTEAPPIDPSRQKKEFIQQFIEREKNKDIKAQQIWKSFRGSNDVYRKRTENLAWRIWTRSKTKGSTIHQKEMR